MALSSINSGSYCNLCGLTTEQLSALTGLVAKLNMRSVTQNEIGILLVTVEDELGRAGITRFEGWHTPTGTTARICFQFVVRFRYLRKRCALQCGVFTPRPRHNHLRLLSSNHHI